MRMGSSRRNCLLRILLSTTTHRSSSSDDSRLTNHQPTVQSTHITQTKQQKVLRSKGGLAAPRPSNGNRGGANASIQNVSDLVRGGYPAAAAAAAAPREEWKADCGRRRLW
ncbi:uncharacterized protein BKA78DRAFT_318725 [Phyllosticta capitalensis]|uniref:uncharacterized protein n=1 Tax=Phyllosticta capitalensis TaxID=121624 RepID=UPI0031310799